MLRLRLSSLVLLSLLVACKAKDDGGDSGDSGAGDSGDSGAGDSGDSGAGDSGDSGAGDSGDSGGGDSGDSGDTLVHVTVYDPYTGAPDPNEAVLFFEADGTFLTEEQTDGDGRAAAEVGAGGTVVVMVHQDDDALPYGPFAYFDVQPGDELAYLGLPPTGETRTTLAFPEEAGATSYRYGAACPGEALLYGVVYSLSNASSLPSCAAGDVLVAAQTASGAFAVVGAAGVDTTAGVTLPGPWIPVAPVELTATGLDASAETVSLDAWHLLGRARVPGAAGESGTPSARRFQASGSMAQGNGLEYLVWLTQERAGFIDQTAFLRRDAEADVAVDATATTLPWLTPPAFDAASHTLGWTQEGSGTLDGLVGWAGFGRGDASFYWGVGAATAGGPLDLPVLPDPWTDYNPQASDDTSAEFLFLRGEGLGDLARRDPTALLYRLYGLRGEEVQIDHAYAFTRTFLP